MKHSVLFVLLPLVLTAAVPAQNKPAAPRVAPGTAGSATAASAAPAGDPVVLTVGDRKITKTEFEAIVATLPQNERTQVNTPQERRKLASEIAGMEALAAKARASKLDQTPAVQEMLLIQSDSMLANAMVKRQMAMEHADTAALHAYYDAHKADFEQIKAVHILIRFQGSQVPVRTGQKELTDAEALAKAQEIRQKLDKGGDFAQLAKTESDDTGSAAEGGQLPEFGHGQMVPEFEKAAFSLKAGEISQPVKTQFGYHIIKVQEHTTKPFEQAQTQVEQEMARAFVDNTRREFPATLDEGFFGKE